MLGETNFRTLEIPRSGSKAQDGEEEKRRKKERKSARKHAWRTQAAWPNKCLLEFTEHRKITTL